MNSIMSDVLVNEFDYIINQSLEYSLARVDFDIEVILDRFACVEELSLLL